MQKRIHRHYDAAETHTPWVQKLTQAAFVLAFAVVIARATMNEVVRDPFPLTPGAEPTPRAPGPTTSLVLNLLLCVPAMLVLLRRIIDPEFRLRSRISHGLFAVFTAWAATSTLWASDKFLALISSSHLIGAAALMWAMTQLVHSWLRVRLVAGVCFALLLIYVAHGAMYRFIDVPDNIKFWQEHKEDELRRRGWEPDSFAAMQFEKKLIGGEMIGFNSSPNSFAAMIVMLGIVCTACAIQRISDRDEPGWAAAIIVGLLAATWVLYYTHSNTALATPILAAACFLALGFFGNLIGNWRRWIYAVAVISIVLVTSLMIARGIRTGTLFHASLTFRWRYWTGAAKVFRQHPTFGVGWANFGEYWLGVRQPIASEEIKDPHNLIVRAFVELGLIGGALMIAWLARAWWEMTSPGLPAARQERLISNGAATAKAIFALIGLGMLINVISSIDFGVNTPGWAGYVVIELMKRLLYLGLGLLGIAIVSLRSSKLAQLDDRPVPWILCGSIIAIGMFLVHNLIDFSLFEAGPMCMFATLVGAALGARASDVERMDGGRDRALIALGVGATLSLAAFFAIVLPVGIAENSAQRGDEELRTSHVATAARFYRDAFANLWIKNADYADRACDAMQLAGEAPEAIRAVLDSAVATDPMDVRYYLARANYELRLGDPDSRRVIPDYEQAIKLNPNDVSAHRDFARALLRFGQRQRAKEQYREALRYNDLLDAPDPKRLSPQQIAEIEQQIKTLE